MTVTVSVSVCVTVTAAFASTGVVCDTGMMLNAGVGALGEVEGGGVVLGMVFEVDGEVWVVLGLGKVTVISVVEVDGWVVDGRVYAGAWAGPVVVGGATGVCEGEERTVGSAVVVAMVVCNGAVDSDCPDTIEEAGMTSTGVEAGSCTAVVDGAEELDVTAVGSTLANAVPVKVYKLRGADSNEAVFEVELSVVVVGAELTAGVAMAEFAAVDTLAVVLAIVVTLAIPAPTGDGTIPNLAAASALASHWTTTPV